MSDRYTRIPELWVHSRRPSAFPLEYKHTMKWCFKEVWESKVKKREKGNQLVSLSQKLLCSFSWPSVGSYSSQNSPHQFRHQASGWMSRLCTVSNSDASGSSLDHKLCPNLSTCYHLICHLLYHDITYAIVEDFHPITQRRTPNKSDIQNSTLRHFVQCNYENSRLKVQML